VARPWRSQQSPGEKWGLAYDADAELAQLRVVHRGRRLGEETDRALRLREGDPLANRVGARQQHDQAVEAEGDPAVRWCAEGERLQQEAEARVRLALRHAEEREHALLHVRAMDPDAAAAELDAVEHEIVGLRADSERVPLETLEVLVGGRREGMVHGDVAARVRIALEERGVDHPQA